jgi:hypothetical protein
MFAALLRPLPSAPQAAGVSASAARAPLVHSKRATVLPLARGALSLRWCRRSRSRRLSSLDKTVHNCSDHLFGQSRRLSRRESTVPRKPGASLPLKRSSTFGRIVVKVISTVGSRSSGSAAGAFNSSVWRCRRRSWHPQLAIVLSAIARSLPRPTGERQRLDSLNVWSRRVVTLI